MMQQVNLYQPTPVKKRTVFPASTLFQFCLLALLIFLGGCGYQYLQLDPLRDRLAMLEHELQQQSQQVIVGSVSSEQKIPNSANEEIDKLTRQLRQRQLIASALTNQVSANTRGFSAYLEAFARGHVEGTWLTHIGIRQGGVLIGLEGKALSTDLVPDYVSNLAMEQGLVNNEFDIIELARADAAGSESIRKFLIGTN